MPSYRSRVTVTDAQVFNNLERIGSERVFDIAEEALKEGAEVLKQGMQEDVAKDTYELEESIEVRPVQRYGKKKMVVKVGPHEKDRFYAMMNEFGTSKMQAHPFIRTQIQKHKSEIRKIIRDAIKGGLGL